MRLVTRSGRREMSLCRIWAMTSHVFWNMPQSTGLSEGHIASMFRVEHEERKEVVSPIARGAPLSYHYGPVTQLQCSPGT
jgi:hypothetical protein